MKFPIIVLNDAGELGLVDKDEKLELRFEVVDVENGEYVLMQTVAAGN